ncbi:MAG: hypothetical protein RI935_660 [Candidatus Parcubacteria bacterium]|jgi:hypothetical protein
MPERLQETKSSEVENGARFNIYFFEENLACDFDRALDSLKNLKELDDRVIGIAEQHINILLESGDIEKAIKLATVIKRKVDRNRLASFKVSTISTQAAIMRSFDSGNYRMAIRTCDFFGNKREYSQEVKQKASQFFASMVEKGDIETAYDIASRIPVEKSSINALAGNEKVQAFLAKKVSFVGDSLIEIGEHGRLKPKQETGLADKFSKLRSYLHTFGVTLTNNMSEALRDALVRYTKNYFLLHEINGRELFFINPHLYLGFFEGGENNEGLEVFLQAEREAVIDLFVRNKMYEPSSSSQRGTFSSEETVAVYYNSVPEDIVAKKLEEVAIEEFYSSVYNINNIISPQRIPYILGYLKSDRFTQLIEDIFSKIKSSDSEYYLKFLVRLQDNLRGVVDISKGFRGKDVAKVKAGVLFFNNDKTLELADSFASIRDYSKYDSGDFIDAVNGLTVNVAAIGFDKRGNTRGQLDYAIENLDLLCKKIQFPTDQKNKIVDKLPEKAFMYSLNHRSGGYVDQEVLSFLSVDFLQSQEVQQAAKEAFIKCLKNQQIRRDLLEGVIIDQESFVQSEEVQSIAKLVFLSQLKKGNLERLILEEVITDKDSFGKSKEVQEAAKNGLLFMVKKYNQESSFLFEHKVEDLKEFILEKEWILHSQEMEEAITELVVTLLPKRDLLEKFVSIFPLQPRIKNRLREKARSEFLRGLDRHDFRGDILEKVFSEEGKFILSPEVQEAAKSAFIAQIKNDARLNNKLFSIILNQEPFIQSQEVQDAAKSTFIAGIKNRGELHSELLTAISDKDLFTCSPEVQEVVKERFFEDLNKGELTDNLGSTYVSLLTNFSYIVSLVDEFSSLYPDRKSIVAKYMFVKKFIDGGTSEEKKIFIETIHDAVSQLSKNKSPEMSPEVEAALREVYPKRNYDTYKHMTKYEDRSPDLDHYHFDGNGYVIKVSGVLGYRLKEGARQDKEIIISFSKRIEAIKSISDTSRLDSFLNGNIKEGKAVTLEGKMLEFFIQNGYTLETMDVLFAYQLAGNYDAFVNESADRVNQNTDQAYQEYIKLDALANQYGDPMKETIRLIHSKVAEGDDSSIFISGNHEEVKKKTEKVVSVITVDLQKVPKDKLTTETIQKKVQKTVRNTFQGFADIEERSAYFATLFSINDVDTLEETLRQRISELFVVASSSSIDSRKIEALQGNVFGKIQAEIAKYEAVKEVDVDRKGEEKMSKERNIKGYFSKTAYNAHARMVADVCLANDPNMLVNKNYFEFVLFDEERKVCMGTTMLLVMEDADKKYLLYCPNPSVGLVSEVSAKVIYQKISDIIISFARDNTFDGVLVNKTHGNSTNRAGLFQKSLEASCLKDGFGREVTINLEKSHPLGGGYSYQKNLQAIWLKE